MKFVLDLWPEDGDHQLTPAQAVGRAIDTIRDRGEELAWDVQTDNGELIAEVTPEDLAELKRVLVWESGGTDEPGDQNASSACVEHGHWSLGPQGDGTWGVELIEQEAETLIEIATGGIDLGHFPTEQAAKDAAQEVEDRGLPA